MSITDKTKKYIEHLSKALLGQGFSQLSEEEKTVIESIATGETVASNTNEEFEEQLSFGQRLADKIATFGGSWFFIILFLGVLISWMAFNALYLTEQEAFDPYPFILLNLVLSSLAAFQAPIIMMSQNRQAAKDRIEAEKNYEVSLKSDLEIIRLHQKLDLIMKSLNIPDEGNRG